MSILSGANLTRIAAGHLKKFPQIVDEISEGLLKYTQDANISAGIVRRAKELKRPSARPEKAHKERMKRAAASALRGKSGSEKWPKDEQIRRAKERANSIVSNLRDDYKSRPYTDDQGILKEGTAYFLSPAQEKKLKKLLYPIKLKEIQEGTPYLELMTIGHRYPNKGVLSTGRRNTLLSGGKEHGRGFTSWENITDDAGNLNLVPMLENIRAGNVVPDEFRAMIPAGGVLAANTADASILSSRFTPEELRKRKELAARRRSWVADKLPLLTPIFSTLMGPYSKGTPGGEQGWRKSLIDPTWGGGLRR